MNIYIKKADYGDSLQRNSWVFSGSPVDLRAFATTLLDASDKSMNESRSVDLYYNTSGQMIINGEQVVLTVNACQVDETSGSILRRRRSLTALAFMAIALFVILAAVLTSH